jgi:hypothetical protein
MVIDLIWLSGDFIKASRDDLRTRDRLKGLKILRAYLFQAIYLRFQLAKSLVILKCDPFYVG